MKLVHISLMATLFHAACGSDVRPSSEGLVQSFSMNAQLTSDVSKMHEDIEKAADELAATNSKAESVRSMIEELDEQKELNDSTIVPEIEAQNKTKSVLQKELGALRGQLAASTNPAEQASLQSQIDQGDIVEDQLNAKIDELRLELDQARQGEETTAQAIVDKINELQTTYNTTLTVLNTSRTQHVRTLNQLEETKDTNSKLGEISESLRGLNSRLQVDLAAAQDRIVVLKQQLAELQGRYEDLKLTSGEALERLDQVNGQLGSARAEVDELQLQVNRLAAERDKALIAQKDAERRAADAERRAAAAEAARRAAERENAALRQQLANERARNAGL